MSKESKPPTELVERERQQAWTKRPVFVEEMQSCKVHPSANPIVGDLRDEVVALLDGTDVGPDDLGKAAFAFGKLFRWCLAVDPTRKRQTVLAEIGLRMLAVAWVLDPNVFGERISLTALAKKLGFDAANISPLTAVVTRRFGIRNSFQSHGMNGAHTDGSAGGDDDDRNSEQGNGGDD